MTVTELLERLADVYPGATSEALRGVKSAYYALLRKREGDALRDACDAVLGSFRATTRQPFPVAADFAAHLPAQQDHIGRPALDFGARAERIRWLTDDWLHRQGRPQSRGIPELLRALVHIAEPIIALRGWSEDPATLTLDRDQIRLAVHRAVSQERYRQFGVNGTAAQTEQVCQQWGIEFRAEDWMAPPSMQHREAA